MKCPNCNETNHEPNAVYCHNCGAYLLKRADPQPPVTPPLQPPIYSHSTNDGAVLKWLVGIVIAIAAILLFVHLYPESSKDANSTEISTPKVSEIYPNELSGNYMARKIYGDDKLNATVKVYREGNGYAINVYSSNITRKHFFSYNPSTGEIVSEELGNGKAIIKELTNETKITFEGWELIK